MTTKHFNAGINDSQPSYMTLFGKENSLKNFPEQFDRSDKRSGEVNQSFSGWKTDPRNTAYNTVLNLPHHTHFSPFTQGQPTKEKTLEVKRVSAFCKMGTNVCHPDSIPSVSTDGEGLRRSGFKSSCLGNPWRLP